jgi:hypothetical protein
LTQNFGCFVTFSVFRHKHEIFLFLPSLRGRIFVRPDRRQKAILSSEGGRIILSANERIAEFLGFAIQAKLAYAGKLRGRIFVRRERCTFSEKSGIINVYCFK